MNDNILSVSGRTFHKFIAYLTDQLSRPKTKFIRQILCGVLFSENLILTKVASKVPHPGRLTAIAKVFNLRSFVPAREKFCPSKLCSGKRKILPFVVAETGKNSTTYSKYQSYARSHLKNGASQETILARKMYNSKISITGAEIVS